MLGFFGKLPSQGDFVSRNLPYDLIEYWDEWLQEAVGYSQQQLGQAWKSYFLKSPPWRLACAPGICGTHAFIGILFPSTDRVGRCFPMLVGMPLPGRPRLTALPLVYEHWLHRVEQAVATALQERFALEDFIRQLETLGTPAQECPSLPASGNTVIPADGYYLLDDKKDFAMAVAHRSSPSPGSIWWSGDSAGPPLCVVVCRTLPAAGRFTAFLNGDWDRLDWRRQTVIHPERK